MANRGEPDVAVLLLISRYSIALTAAGAAALGLTDLTNREAQLMLVLLGGPASPGAVADAIGAEASLVSRVGARLVQEGLVSSGVVPDDRRSRQLSLTARGRTRLRKFNEHLAVFLEEQEPLAAKIIATAGGRPAEPVQGALAAMRVLADAGSRYIEDLESSGVAEIFARPLDRHVLTLVTAKGPLRPSAISEELAVPRARTSESVRRLERSGLVTCQRAQLDAREVMVEATPAGREAFGSLVSVFDRNRQSLVAAVAATVGSELRTASGL